MWLTVLQYVAALLRQRIPVLDPLQPCTFRHKRFRDAIAAYRHLHCLECDVSCDLDHTCEDA